MNQVQGVADRPAKPVERLHDDHVTLARVRDDLTQARPVGRRAGLLIDVDPVSRDPGLLESIDLPIEILLDRRHAHVSKFHRRTVPQVVDVRGKRNAFLGPTYGTVSA